MPLVIEMLTLMAAVAAPFILTNRIFHRIALLLISLSAISINYFPNNPSVWIHLAFILFTIVLKAKYRSTILPCDDVIVSCYIIFYLHPLAWKLI
jgi:hypothetical protein